MSDDAPEFAQPRRTRLLRVAEHIRTQNWTAIAIDFAIVVIGVFVGIQAANWNAQRAEDAKAEEYLARIRGSLDADLNAIDRRDRFWRQVIDYGKQAIHHSETGQWVDGSAWKTVLAYYQASQIMTFALDDATYVEMRDGGELGLIRNPRLRSELSTYYAINAAEEGYLFRLQPEYRRIVRGLTPAAAADHIWSRCWQFLPELREQRLLDCESPISEAQAQAILDGYLKDANLLPELRFWVANQGVALSSNAGYRHRLERMLSQLGEDRVQ
jgi:hypothetical protein